MALSPLASTWCWCWLFGAFVPLRGGSALAPVSCEGMSVAARIRAGMVMGRLLGVADEDGDGKGFEEVGGSARGRGLEPQIPGLEEGEQVVAKSGELDETGLGRGELLRGEGPDLAAGRRALLPFPQHQGEFGQGETEGQGAPDQQDPGEG